MTRGIHFKVLETGFRDSLKTSFYIFQVNNKTEDGNKSDSDYGDDDNWQGGGGADGWDDTPINDEWNDTDDWGLTKEKEVTAKKVFPCLFFKVCISGREKVVSIKKVFKCFTIF